MNETLTRDVVTSSGAPQNPIHLNPIILVSHLICCFIGIPLNAFIAITIVYQRRLRRKPRNVFLLGLILSNLYAFVPAFIELTYFHFPSVTLCRVYVAVVGLPYVTFLINVFLALVDRYTALTHPLWHRRRITVRRVVIWQFLCTLLVSVTYKFPYVAMIIPLECEVQFIQVKLIAFSLLALTLTCVIAQVIVYKRSRVIMRQTSLGGADSARRRVSLSVRALKQVRTREQQAVSESTSEQTDVTLQRLAQNSMSATNDRPLDLSTHIGNSRIGRLEIEATRTLISGVVSLFIMTGPFITFTLTMVTCRMNGLSCQNIGWLAPYFKELVIIHAIYHPLIYLIRSKEFTSALRGPTPF